MPTRQVIAALVLMLNGSAGVLAQRPVEPGQLFPDPAIDVRAPSSQGWELVQSDTRGMAFGHRDKTTGDTFRAEMLVEQMPAGRSTEEFLAMVRASVELRSPEPRYNTLRSVFEQVRERSYTCVRYRGMIEDTRPPAWTRTQSLIIHVRSLICRHPTEPDLMIHISFSQRGLLADDDFDAQADSFIAGVQVPKTP